MDDRYLVTPLILKIPPEGVGFARQARSGKIPVAMDTVLHLSKQIVERPRPGTILGVELRNFLGAEDITVWLELRHRAFARAMPGILSWDAADFAAEFLDKPWWSPDRIWFAVAHDAATGGTIPVGTIALADRGTGAHTLPAVHWLAVLPRWRRRGVGRLLIEALEERCWEQGHREIFLETHEGWTAARQLYEDLGYRPVR